MQLCSHEMLCWQVVTWNMYLKVTTDVSFVDPWMPVWVLVIKMYIVYSSSLQGGMIRNSWFHIMHMYFTDLSTWQVCCWGIMLLRQCVRSFLMLLWHCFLFLWHAMLVLKDCALSHVLEEDPFLSHSTPFFRLVLICTLHSLCCLNV